jgi:hypothetical protein
MLHMFDAYKAHNRNTGAVEVHKMEAYLRTVVLPSGPHRCFCNIVVHIW